MATTPTLDSNHNAFDCQPSLLIQRAFFDTTRTTHAHSSKPSPTVSPNWRMNNVRGSCTGFRLSPVHTTLHQNYDPSPFAARSRQASARGAYSARIVDFSVIWMSATLVLSFRVDSGAITVALVSKRNAGFLVLFSILVVLFCQIQGGYRAKSRQKVRRKDYCPHFSRSGDDCSCSIDLSIWPADRLAHRSGHDGRDFSDVAPGLEIASRSTKSEKDRCRPRLSKRASLRLGRVRNAR